jgi:hypothetical protein
LRRVDAEITPDDAGALGGERQGSRTTYAASGARDDADFP